MNEHLLEPFKSLTRSTKLKNKNKWCKYHGTSKPHCADGDFGQVIPFDKRDETTYKRCSGTCKYKETDWLPKKNKGRRDMFSTDFQVRNIRKKKTFHLIGKGATCPICLETTKNAIIQDLPCKHEIHKSCFAKFIEPKYDMVQQHTHNLYYASHTGHVEIALFRYVEVRTNPHKEISCPICRTKIFDKKCPKSKS